MTTSVAGSRATTGTPTPDHAAALSAVTALILPAQTPGGVGRADVQRIVAEAEEHGWPDVVLVAEFVGVLASRFDSSIDGRELLGRILTQARRDGDQVWEALALAMGATDAVPDPRPTLDADRDLARAVVLLRSVPEGHPMLASAHGQCSMAFLSRDMWERALDHTDAASDCLRGTGEDEWRLAISLYNRAEIGLRRLCALRGLGPRDELVVEADLARSAIHEVPQDLLPEDWRRDLHIFENLVDAIGPSPTEPARPLADRDGAEYAAYVDIAEALMESSPGRARPLLTRALVALDPVRETEFHLLALTLDAELEATEHGSETAGLRLGRDLAARRGRAQRAAVEAMDALIENEYMSGEHDRLRMAAEIDALTGVANRRGLSTHLARLVDPVDDSRRDDEAVLVVIDVDNFKGVNDTHGHEVGDEVLVRVAHALRSAVRDTDLVVRWGGDEFLLLLDTQDLNGAGRRCRQIASHVRNEPWDELSPGLAVTVSIGLAVGKLGELDAVRDAADRALYRAKARGRDGIAF